MKSKQRNSFMNFSLFNLEGMPSKVVEVRDGGLAQLGERLPCKQEVSGSIPLISTISLKEGRAMTEAKRRRANSSAG